MTRAAPLLRYSFVVGLALLGLSACGGRNIHRDLKDDSEVLSRNWTRSTRQEYLAGDRGAENSNAILVENTLVFGNTGQGLVSIYPTINQQRWALNIPNGIASPITLERDTLYFGGGDGFLYAVHQETGKVLWKYELRNPTVSRPTVAAGRVFVSTSDDTVYAFDASTGKWLWHYRRRSGLSATIHGASAPLVDGNEVLAGLSDGFLVALSLDDGQLKWERRLHQAGKFTDVDAQPALDEGVLYVPSYDGALYALKRQGGETLWRFDAGGSKQVVVEEGRLFLPSSDGTIYALQKSNAKVLWKFELDDGVPTQLIVTESHVIVGSSHQYLYVLDKTSGKGLYRYNVGHGSGFTGAPAFDREKQRLYLLSSAGNLFSFTLKKPRSQPGTAATAPQSPN